VRRQTYQRLLTFLDDVSPRPRSSPAADLGAGTGWLSFRLAQRGHPTLALDASLDADFGLGASFPYASRYPDRILPVRADLDVLPLRPGGLDLILFNASLHYARDVRATLRRAVSALAPGGRLLILDTPIYFRPSAAPANGERQLGRIELLEELEAAGLETQTLHLFRGFRWLAYQARHLLRRGNPFSFPLLIGTKPSEGGE
jgi:SAM-dependent methyltransferase